MNTTYLIVGGVTVVLMAAVVGYSIHQLKKPASVNTNPRNTPPVNPVPGPG